MDGKTGGSKLKAPSVRAVFILSEGERVYGKYWTDGKATATVKLQKEFEQRAYKKTRLSASLSEVDAIEFEKYTLLFKRLADNTVLYVLGDPDENELILGSVLNTIEEAISTLCNGALDCNSLEHALAQVCLVVDECVMDGLVLETDAANVADRASMAQTLQETPIQDQTLQQFASSAREKLINVFR